MTPEDHAPTDLSIPCVGFFSTLLALIPPSMGKTGAMLGASPPHRLLSSASTPVPRSPRVASLAGPALLSLDISLRYLRLAFQGDDRAGLLPFLGTSTTALGGFRLRF